MTLNIIVLIAGLLFGLGLSLSQMIYRDRVLGFREITGTWYATLLFVLAGAVTVTLITFLFVLRFPHPLLSKHFYVPRKQNIDIPLILGAAIFGIGWGIGGYCPRRSIVALVWVIWNPVLFFIAFILVSVTYNWYSTRKHHSS